MTEAYICTACGTQYAPSDKPPAQCTICEEERQYVPPAGQSWTTLKSLAARSFNSWREHEPGVLGIGTQPNFAIGQRALLLRTPQKNILWDCISLLDEATEALILQLGGLDAIAISHPHYYTCMQDWAHRFDCPVYLHAADSEWIMRPDPSLHLWQGETLEIAQGTTLLRLGGHFPGGAVLHWAKGAEGRGAILSGDIVQVAPDVSRVSFLWSYPNMMPLSENTVRRIADTLASRKYDRIYGAFPGRQVMSDAASAVARSAGRYIELLNRDQA